MISIAMATYNGEKYLQEQLDSILAQTVTDWELVICDDCSTDGTAAILQEYAARDGRIRIYANARNIGFKRNFEKAITLCSGDYIALSDQDDVWLPEHLEVLLKNIEGYAISGGNAALIDAEGNDLHRLLNDVDGFRFMPAGTLFLYRVLINSDPIQGASMLIRRSMLERCLPIPDEVRFHDAWFIACACLCGGISYTFGIVSKYRQHGTNVTFTMHNKEKTSLRRLWTRRIGYLLHGVETDRFCYRRELATRFGVSDPNFKAICGFLDHVLAKRISWRDVCLIWNNYENITTERGHGQFITRLIAWMRMCPLKTPQARVKGGGNK